MTKSSKIYRMPKFLSPYLASDHWDVTTRHWRCRALNSPREFYPFARWADQSYPLGYAKRILKAKEQITIGCSTFVGAELKALKRFARRVLKVRESL